MAIISYQSAEPNPYIQSNIINQYKGIYHSEYYRFHIFREYLIPRFIRFPSKLREHKIANAELLLSFHVVYMSPKNNSEISSKFASCASHDFTRIFISCIWLRIFSNYWQWSLKLAAWKELKTSTKRKLLMKRNIGLCQLSCDFKTISFT